MKNKSLRESSGKMNEEWSSFFKNTLDGALPASVKRTETAHTEPDEVPEGELPGVTFVADLAVMLGDLREAADEAREEGFPGSIRYGNGKF